MIRSFDWIILLANNGLVNQMLRAFAADHMMVDADLVEGNEVEGLIEKLLANPEVAYVQAHWAKHGCYAARIDRA